MSQNFADNIEQAVDTVGSRLVIGFDPLPEAAPSGGDPIAMYRQLYRDALPMIAKKAVAIKPNAAFFEAFGLKGLGLLSEIMHTARASGLQVILDAKRGDIGSTAEAYARAYLDKGSEFEADAITLNPFLGFDTLEPFVKRVVTLGKGIFILAYTSNPGAAAIQEHGSPGKTVSTLIAEKLAELAMLGMGSSGITSIGAVVGATRGERLVAARQTMPSNMFLIPGVGAQGGTYKDAYSALSTNKRGVVINLSRAIFPSFVGKSTAEALAIVEDNLNRNYTDSRGS